MVESPGIVIFQGVGGSIFPKVVGGLNLTAPLRGWAARETTTPRRPRGFLCGTSDWPRAQAGHWFSVGPGSEDWRAGAVLD